MCHIQCAVLSVIAHNAYLMTQEIKTFNPEAYVSVIREVVDSVKGKLTKSNLEKKTKQGPYTPMRKHYILHL